MVIEHIQRKIEEGLCITPQSTPVVWFGNFDKSEVCTISLNPSNREFCDKDGNILRAEKARLCSRRALGVSDSEALDRASAEKVLAHCNTYFQRNPYRRWFNKLEKFLDTFGYSYCEETAVHLDMVQWPTTPFWSELDDSVKQRLLRSDLPFVKGLLKQKSFKIIFLNGKTTVEEVALLLHISLKRIAIHFDRTGRAVPATLYTGIYQNSLVVGWSCYLQSPTVGGHDNIRSLAKVVKKHLPAR